MLRLYTNYNSKNISPVGFTSNDACITNIISTTNWCAENFRWKICVMLKINAWTLSLNNFSEYL